MKITLGLISSLLLFSTASFAQDQESRCTYNCIMLDGVYMKPVSSAADLVNQGYEVAIWNRFNFLKPIDDALFKNTAIPFWNQLRLNTGIYYNQFTGPLYSRKYSTAGIAPGVIAKFPWGSEAQHELFTQFDIRLGEVWASRDAALGNPASSSSSFNVQPVVYAGYLYGFDRFQIGAVAQWMMSSDSSPVIALGGGLRLTFQLDPEHKKSEAASVPAAIAAATPTPELKAPAADIARGKIVETVSNGIQITLPSSRVSFVTGSAKYENGGEAFVKGFCEILKSNSADFEQVKVIGHTDNRGKESSNQKLSLARAKHFVSDLKKAGIDSKILSAEGVGAKEPRDDRNTEEGWRLNRRVVVQISGKGDNAKLAQLINDYDLNFQSNH